MIEVKTQKRYKCDFCKKRGIKRKMEFHELNCYRNPSRICSKCENVGWIMEDMGDENSTMVKFDCPYCKAFDPKKKAEIEKYEKEKSSAIPQENISLKEPQSLF